MSSWTFGYILVMNIFSPMKLWLYLSLILDFRNIQFLNVNITAIYSFFGAKCEKYWIFLEYIWMTLDIILLGGGSRARRVLILWFLDWLWSNITEKQRVQSLRALNPFSTDVQISITLGFSRDYAKSSFWIYF